MDRDASPLYDVQWVARCAHRLRERWPHADPTSIDEAAVELWADEQLRGMEGGEAAAAWLQRGAISSRPHQPRSTP